jgi:hypothetical protein
MPNQFGGWAEPVRQEFVFEGFTILQGLYSEG